MISDRTCLQCGEKVYNDQIDRCLGPPIAFHQKEQTDADHPPVTHVIRVCDVNPRECAYVDAAEWEGIADDGRPYLITVNVYSVKLYVGQERVRAFGYPYRESLPGIREILTMLHMEHT